MALDRIKFNIASFNDADAGGNNYYAGIVYEVFNSNDTLADIYSDAAGANPINQDGISNKSNSIGEAIFYIDSGSYYIKVDSKTEYFDASNTDSNNFKYNHETIQDAIDYDGWDVNGGEVFEVQGYHSVGVGGGKWKTATLGTADNIDKPNGTWILQCSGVPSLVIVHQFGSVFYPDKIGADPAETLQSHTYIQACMDYIEALGRPIAVSIQGSYLLGDSLKARNYASLLGTGNFKVADGVNKQALDIYAEYPIRRIDNTIYSGFSINGNKANQTTSDINLGAGVTIRADVHNPFSNGDAQKRGEFKNIVIENITVNNAKVSGFTFGKNTFVTQSYTFAGLKSNNTTYGVYLSDFCEYITFANCELQANQYGVYDNGSSNISFIGGTYANNTEAGIYAPTTGRNTSKKIISGIHINHNKRGVWIGDGFGTIAERADQWIITDNHIMANDRQGVLGVGGSRVIVKNNIFSGNGGETSGLYSDIQMFGICREWDVDNIHLNSTGDTKCAVLYDNPNASGIDGHSYHKIDGSFEGYTNPIMYTTSANPNTLPLNANTNFIQGVFEYWNNAGAAPSASAANPSANVDINKIPLGTICINNADSTGAERWRAIQAPSSATSATGERSIQVSFIREAVYTT